MAKDWRKGRGKLGLFKPLLGQYRSQSDTDLGPLTCTRTFVPILANAYIQLSTKWEFASGKSYEEHCLFGVGKDRQVRFWSFTSDGKQSEGWLCEAPDVAETSICFEADMDQGRARQVYWSDGGNGFYWIVENRSKKGWNRFMEHHYTPVDPG